MTFQMIHENYNVSDLEKSLAFYGEALGLREVRRNTHPGFTIVYLRDESGHFELELTWLQDHPQKYDLGECEFHLAFAASDFEAAHKKHQEMGCICYENDAMGIYFIGRILAGDRAGPLSVERGEGSEAVECAGSLGGTSGGPFGGGPDGPERGRVGDAGRAGDRAAGPGDCRGRGGAAEK